MRARLWNLNFLLPELGILRLKVWKLLQCEVKHPLLLKKRMAIRLSGLGGVGGAFLRFFFLL